MEWQAKAARLIGERAADGRPRYKTVIASVPRQQGKTALSRAVLATRAGEEPRGDLFGTAQSRIYAARHVITLGEELEAAGDRVTFGRGVGNEHVTWPNGTTYRPLSPTDTGGHGDSIDFMLADEAWTLEAAVVGGFRPAMIARPNSQLLIISTMGTIDSVYWNSLVAKGRETAELAAAGLEPAGSIAYLEYSAPDDEAVFDPSRWAEWMPALGVTVTHDDVRAAMADMEPAEIVRAFGNRTTLAVVSIFPAEWIARAWRVIDPPERFVLAVDVNDEPAGASVATGHLADADDGIGVGVATRLIEARPGSPRWVPELIERMIRDRHVEAVVGDFGGPAKQVQAELEAITEAAYVPLIDRKPRELAADTSRFYDDLRRGLAYIEKADPIADALAGAQRKHIGDMWLVSRRHMTIDASPLIASVLAHGVAAELAVTPRVSAAVYW